MKLSERILYKLKKKGGIYKYTHYDEYKQAQIEGNLAKLDNSWVSEDNIKFLSDYLKNNLSNIEFGLCHGTRRGEEQKWFTKYLGIEVLGTELSPSATQFPNTIEWDFHEVKPEWVNSVDFIYSNSFDHSYDPNKCLDAWMSCLKPGGLCILEWTKGHQDYSKMDPFGGTKRMYKKLIRKNYVLKDFLKGGPTGGKRDKLAFFYVIGHR